MANNRQVISIGVQLDYQKELESMIDDLRAKMKKLGDAANDIELSKNLQSQITALENKLAVVADDVQNAFRNLGDVNIDLKSIKVFQDYLKHTLSDLKKEFDDLQQNVSAFASAFTVDGIGVNNFVSQMTGQFSELQNTAKKTEDIIKQLFTLFERNESNVEVKIDTGKIEQAEKILDRLNVLKSRKRIGKINGLTPTTLIFLSKV